VHRGIDPPQTITLNPAYAEAYFNRANAFGNLKRMDDAIADFGQAIRIRPKFPEASFYLGNAHAAKREFELAIADYDAALLLKPDFAQVFYSRAFIKSLSQRAATQACLGLPQ